MEIPPIRRLIVDLRKYGHSIRKIAENVKKPHSSVQYVLERYNATKSLESGRRSGRPNILQSNHKRAVLRSVREDPKISAPKLAAMLEIDYGIKVVPQTIQSWL